VLLQETRFQPSFKHRPIHGDVREEPVMADPIKASFDVPFANPLWTVSTAHQGRDLVQGISATAFPSKAIRMAIGLGFGDGMELIA
jgi:hypothetical protein